MNTPIFRHLTFVLLGLGVALVAADCQAAAVIYNNRAAWEAAVGPLSGVENFNSFAADTTFINSVVPLNNMTVTGSSGFNGSQTQKIDALPLEFSGFYDLNGTPQLLGDLQGSNQFVRVNFLTPVVSWGADEAGLADVPRTTRIDIFSTSNALLGTIPATSPDNTSRGFYGFDLTSGAASYLVFTNPTGDNDVFGIDNVGFVTIPEPAELAMILGACLGATRCVGARRLCGLRKAT